MVMLPSTEQAYGLALCVLFLQACRHFIACVPGATAPAMAVRKIIFCLNTHFLCGVCLMSRCWLVTFTYAMPVRIYFWFPFLTVLALFESMCMQWLTDMYEWRPLCSRQDRAWLANSVSVSAIEALMAYLFWGKIQQTMHEANPQHNMMMMSNLSNFPLLLAVITATFWKAFIWEAFFDLAHYCRHRGAHTPSMRWFFRRSHDVHHTTAKTQALVAYENFSVHWTDLVFGTAFDYLTGFVVLRLFIQVLNAAMGLEEAVTLFHVCLFYTYARQVELLGHCGDTYWTPPNIFRLIPWCLGIELKTEDHEYHHIILRGNYCKRMKLWDVVFGTYYPPKKVARLAQPKTANGGS